MNDLQVTINVGYGKFNFEFRSDHIKFQWEVFLNTMKTPHTIKLIEDNDWVSYYLCKNDEPIQVFEWEDGNLDNPSNLLEVMTYICKSNHIM
jgi:hypothetical protein